MYIYVANYVKTT